MNSPTHTIITVCLNDLRGLRRTVESIDRQSLDSWQHIIVDGASADGTREWLEELPPDHRRTWTSQKDRGIYDAMNWGAARATGQLVSFLNSGDSLSSPDVTQKVFDDWQVHGWDWAYGALRLTDVEGKVVGAYAFDPFSRTRFQFGLASVPFPSAWLTKSLLANVGEICFDIGSTADQELLMRALRVSEPRVITEFLADFELGGISQTLSPRTRELAWHHMRGMNGLHWRGSAPLDRLASEALAMRSVASRIAKKALGG